MRLAIPSSSWHFRADSQVGEDPAAQAGEPPPVEPAAPDETSPCSN